MKKHSKAGEDSKYNGTALGKSNSHGEIAVEGNEVQSIRMWQERLSRERQKPPLSPPPESPALSSRPASSGLSSIGDRTIADEMDLS